MKNLFSLLSIFLLVILLVLNNTEYSMANPKSTNIKLNLSGIEITFDSPVNYSKDFSWPKETDYAINIYDKDLYTLFENSSIIRKSHWDYGRGIIFGGVKGTLSMTIILYKTTDTKSNLKNDSDFLEALQKDFKIIYDEQSRSESKFELPETFKITKISDNSYGFYEFSVDGDKRLVYGIPLSDQHYLLIKFDFINNSEGEVNNWKEQARETVDFIMTTFLVK